MVKLLRVFMALKRPRSLFEAIEEEEEEQAVASREQQLHSFEAAIISIREEFFSLVQHLPLAVSTALRVFAGDFLEDINTALLSSELYSLEAKND